MRAVHPTGTTVAEMAAAAKGQEWLGQSSARSGIPMHSTESGAAAVHESGEKSLESDASRDGPTKEREDEGGADHGADEDEHENEDEVEDRPGRGAPTSPFPRGSLASALQLVRAGGYEGM